MNLPDYFIADLPADAELSASIIRQACETIRKNREQYLANRSTQSMVQFLAALGANWREPDYKFRKLTLEHGPAVTGFSAPTLAHGLDLFFKQVTAANLEALLEQDLGDVRRLDQMAATAPEDKTGRAAIATAPEMIAHILAGNIPCSAFQSVL